MGARALRLALYRVDGKVKVVDIGVTMPTRSATHVARLIDLKLERSTETIDAGFGFEALDLAVTVAERMEPTQTDLASAPDSGNPERCAALVDRLRERLGPRSVRQLKPIASHLPERAETACAATGSAAPACQRRTRRGRAPFSCCLTRRRWMSRPLYLKVHPDASAGAV
jgi:protein ImuB